ncbi:Ephrin type-A receptor 4-B [Geodia barretti]|uniref:Ephrin type-A receptor 4-B n=2 Tax=Geodia barretti TaxID=519541 RepID=A0AA35SX36_GEOBA|nr:Ephrin type-A receptor 4-B [Geodia barretti]
MGKNKMLLGVALFLLFALGHAVMAPGDESSRCTNQLDPYPPSMMMLMNSRHYSALLGPEGVWDQMDLDDNDPETSFNPTYFKHNAGGICRWSVMSCGYRSGWQDNYLFTQFISKAAPPDTTHTVRVIVDILYTLSSCRARYNCNPKFQLLKFETDGPQPREVFTDHTNYQSIRVRTGSSAVTQRLVENIDIPANIEGIYLAVRDNTSCIQVAQMQVYRYQCPRKQEGLVVFPDTAAPVDNDITIIAECMPNSSPVTPNDMAMTCDKDGNWMGAGSCRCDPGYKRVRGRNGESCVACQEGTYRTGSDPEGVCLSCPGNTESDEVGAPECECQTGYFRNLEGMSDTCPASQTRETVSDDCTQPPSSPRNLVKTGSTAESLSVSWTAPEYSGGRSDLYYRVHYSDPDNVGILLESHCTQCHTGTSCTISGLRPATVYVVQVSAHNGVSDQDEGGALARMTEITLATDSAPPSAPQRPQAFCQVVVWEEPEHINGVITKYLVKYLAVSHEVSGDRNSFVLPTELPSGTVIRIYAVNVAGTGPFATATIPSDCAGLDTPDALVTCPSCPGCPACPIPTPSECPTIPVPTVTRTTTVAIPPVTITRTTTVARIVPTTVTTTATVTRVSTSTVRTTVTRTTTRTTSTPCPTPPPSSPTTGAAVSRPG